MAKIAVFAAGLALIVAGAGVWIWRLYFQKGAQDSSGADVEGFGLKFAVKNDALAIICFGIILIYLSTTLPVPPSPVAEPVPPQPRTAASRAVPDFAPSTYFLQFGSFQALSNAITLRDDLTLLLKDCALKPVRLVTSNDVLGVTPGWHAVIIGPHSTKDEAEADLISVLRCAGPKLKTPPQVRIASKS